MPAECARGFTLVEVLVALAVLAIALTAVYRGFGQDVDLSAALRDRTLALWIAQNRLALHQAERAWPEMDTTEGEAELGGRRWRWRERVSASPEAELRRLEIEILPGTGDEVLARLVGFLRRPAPSR
jgi:general secretion pathway protein I